MSTSNRPVLPPVASATDSASLLRESEQRLELALSAGQGIGVWDWDVRNDRVVADERFATIFGVDPELARQGAPGEHFFRDIHPDDVDRVRSAIDTTLRTGERFSEEYRVQGASGGERWVLAEGTCKRSPDGGAIRFPGVCFDITARKVAEMRLRELNADLERKIIERTQARGRTWQVSPDLLGALNSQGYFETSNPAWKTVLGWSEEEVASMSIFELLHPDDVERTRVGFNLTQIGQPAIRFPNRYRHKNGHYRWISWVGVPEEGYVYCSGRDITEEREQAEALSRAEAALRQAQKMEALGHLTGGIAHDFNNLLQVISANLHLAQRLIEHSEQALPRLANALAAVQRGARLSGQLLAFSRKQPINPSVFNPAQLLADVEDLLRRSLGDGVAIDIVAPAGVWNTLADETQLENAILNLAINARDAMQGSGRLRLELANVQMAATDRPHATPLAAGDYVALRVSDTGCGMTADVLAHVFEPFYTTKEVGRGTGLGLAMVYGFMQQSGGGVQIDSEIGRGTTVTLYLPRCLEPVRSQMPPIAAGSVRGGTETILVAEDDAAVREASVTLLRDLGYSVVEASDGDMALEQIRAGAPVDLLLIDVVMPGTRKSTEVVKEAHFLLPHLAVLYTSGYAEGDLLKGGRLEPNVLLLSKPYTVGVLENHIQHALANSGRLRPAQKI